MKRARIELKPRLVVGDSIAMGPGKADLLEHIAEAGSISAAAKKMQMSYKRAWMLVEEMNAAFALPLVASARGGQGGGGARLTEAGDEVLRLYREVVARSEAAAAEPIAALEGMLRGKAESDHSGGK